jgi:hypothetical protein
VHHVVKADDRDKRARLQHDQPAVGEAGDGVADHLRKDDPFEHLAAGQAVGLRRLDLPARNSEDGTAEGFRQERAEDEPQCHGARHERVDVDIARAHPVSDCIDRDLAAVKDQQHQDEFRHTTDQCRVDVGSAPRRSGTRKLRSGADHAEDAGRQQRDDRHAER